MPTSTTRVLAWLLLMAAAHGDTVILQIHVLEGENGVFAASGRAVRPVTVRVTSETGAPVAGVAVSFRLPEDGVTGTFQNGLRTDMVLSGPDGRAVAPNIAWGPLAGQARIRVTAALEQARAGVLVPVYVSAAGGENTVVAGAAAGGGGGRPVWVEQQPNQPQPQLRRTGSRTRWILALAGGLGAGAAFALVKKPGASAAAAAPPLSVGQPSISIGR
jgi:hypothetical protein